MKLIYNSEDKKALNEIIRECRKKVYNKLEDFDSMDEAIIWFLQDLIDEFASNKINIEIVNSVEFMKNLILPEDGQEFTLLYNDDCGTVFPTNLEIYLSWEVYHGEFNMDCKLISLDN